MENEVYRRARGYIDIIEQIGELCRSESEDCDAVIGLKRAVLNTIRLGLREINYESDNPISQRDFE